MGSKLGENMPTDAISSRNHALAYMRLTRIKMSPDQMTSKNNA